MASNKMLQHIAGQISICAACELWRDREKTVPGSDLRPDAPLLLCGEGPGAEEAASGRAFCGDSGKLLDQILASVGLQRKDVPIINVVKCRPPENRKPKPEEIEACRGFLENQIRVISPLVIGTLGKTATDALLRSPEPITALVGKWQWYQLDEVMYPVMPLFHPAYLLRKPTKEVGGPKHTQWLTMKMITAKLQELQGSPK